MPLPSEGRRAPTVKLKRIFPAAIENDEPRDERAQQCDEDAISHLIHADMADLRSEKKAEEEPPDQGDLGIKTALQSRVIRMEDNIAQDAAARACEHRKQRPPQPKRIALHLNRHPHAGDGEGREAHGIEEETAR